MNSKPDMRSWSDEKLMEYYQEGQAQAFEMLFERYAGRVMSYLKKKSGSEKVAEDLTQEVFFKLHRSRGLYRKSLPFAPWIFSISRSVFLDSIKKGNLEDTMLPEEFDKLLSAEKSGSGDHLKDLLETLPESQRQVVALRVFDEATFEEIAKRLSTSPANSRQLFSRGIKQLKTKMKRKE